MSLSDALAPRFTILSTVDCQPALSWRREMERSSSWHCEQTFSVSALPVASGSWAKAVAPKRSATARSLVFNRETETINRSIVSAEEHLRAAAGEASVARDKRGDHLPTIPQFLARRAVEG